jgi:hypothetical protein
VSGFEDYSQAMDYFTAFKTEGTIRNPSASKITPFIISLENLKTLSNDKNPERYFLFFNEKYSQRIIVP